MRGAVIVKYLRDRWSDRWRLHEHIQRVGHFTLDACRADGNHRECVLAYWQWLERGEFPVAVIIHGRHADGHAVEIDYHSTARPHTATLQGRGRVVGLCAICNRLSIVIDDLDDAPGAASPWLTRWSGVNCLNQYRIRIRLERGLTCGLSGKVVMAVAQGFDRSECPVATLIDECFTDYFAIGVDLKDYARLASTLEGRGVVSRHAVLRGAVIVKYLRDRWSDRWRCHEHIQRVGHFTLDACRANGNHRECVLASWQWLPRGEYPVAVLIHAHHAVGRAVEIDHHSTARLHTATLQGRGRVAGLCAICNRLSMVIDDLDGAPGAASPWLSRCSGVNCLNQYHIRIRLERGLTCGLSGKVVMAVAQGYVRSECPVATFIDECFTDFFAIGVDLKGYARLASTLEGRGVVSRYVVLRGAVIVKYLRDRWSDRWRCHEHIQRVGHFTLEAYRADGNHRECVLAYWQWLPRGEYPVAVLIHAHHAVGRAVEIDHHSTARLHTATLQGRGRVAGLCAICNRLSMVIDDLDDAPGAASPWLTWCSSASPLNIQRIRFRF